MLEAFKEYLLNKKIDEGRFKLDEPNLWNEWKATFEQVHPDSFTAQKLYLINKIRRKYPLKVEQKTVESPKKRIRPIIKK